MAQSSLIGNIALVLVILGGINWGLVGLFQFDVVQAIFSQVQLVQNIICVVIGLSALYMIVYSVR